MDKLMFCAGAVICAIGAGSWSIAMMIKRLESRVQFRQDLAEKKLDAIMAKLIEIKLR
jgi:hypothetical protein